jgi:hypothetical protein
MKLKYSISFVAAIFLAMITSSTFLLACSKGKSAVDTIEPVKYHFESITDRDVITPDFSSIENAAGVILTWQLGSIDCKHYTEYSWVLALNTDDLKKALLFFDSARAWNTEKYIFLPVTPSALEIHTEVGLTVPQSIYDEDGMNRIREIVFSGEVPEGSFVDQFEQFME